MTDAPVSGPQGPDGPPLADDAADVPRFEIAQIDGRRVLVAQGDWTVWTVAAVEADVRHFLTGHVPPPADELDASGLGSIDTSGAHVLWQMLAPSVAGGVAVVRGGHPTVRRLLDEVAPHTRPPQPLVEVRDQPVRRILTQIGESMVHLYGETRDTLHFVGETMVALSRVLSNPGRIRWLPTVAVMESAGFNAIPIVATLSFFIGAVVAFMGATTLASFGATIFTVELVGIAVLREFGVLITAIILAGRSDSAFTAQIGAMKMNQEVDAMRTLGLDPIEMLVVPRVIALLVMTPILTFIAMIAGLAGGLLVCVVQLDISPALFLARLQENVGTVHFWTGIAKAPVFAIIMAIIGCRQGLMVGNDVISLGRNTTAAVVQAIFMVIVVDAVFAMVYLELDL